MRTWLLVLAACSAPVKPDPIEWAPPIEIAKGGGYKGPWHQNESASTTSTIRRLRSTRAAVASLHGSTMTRKSALCSASSRAAAPARGQRIADADRVLVAAASRISPRDPKHVFVVWQEIVFSGGTHGGEIYFARSLDGGRTFEPPLNLSQSPNGDGKARIDANRWLNGSLDLVADAGGTLYTAWTDYEGTLWFTRSEDEGKHFTPPLAVVINHARPARAPALATGAGVIYLAWTVGEDARADIHLTTSSDGGASFATTTIVTRTAGYSDAPKLAVDARGTLHLAYADSHHGPFDRSHIRYLRSRDRGRTFEEPRIISAPHPHDAMSAAFPSLAIDGERVIVTWELYPVLIIRAASGLAYSADGGATFCGRR